MRRLGKREIEELRERLRAAERSLLQHVTEHRCACRVVEDAVESEEDRGQSAPLEVSLERLEQHEREELGRILAALARIEQGTYGICSVCGEGIPLARLRVVPATPHCVDCHTRAEREAERR